MSTVIIREVDHFNQLAETWWDHLGPMWPLHKLNALRVPFIIRHIQTHFDTRPKLRGLKVLDVGCGAGLLSEAVARCGASVVGIDPAERNVEIARQHAGALDVTYHQAAIEAVVDSTQDSSQQDFKRQFDVVMNMEVVEHVSDLEAFIRHAASWTRPGGLMFAATINRTIFSLLTAILGAEHILGWLPKGTHTWSQFVKPKELEALLSDYGFECVERTGVAVNPLTRSMSLTRYLGGNYMMALRKKL